MAKIWPLIRCVLGALYIVMLWEQLGSDESHIETAAAGVLGKEP